MNKNILIEQLLHIKISTLKDDTRKTLETVIRLLDDIDKKEDL